MSMKLWAEKEVEIACKRENPDRKEGEWDYGCACYESALKAYKSLMEDGHSGFSIGMTKQILNRLIDGKVLTPIEDTPDIWEYRWRDDKKHRNVYQCTRMGSLFKNVYDDGTAEFDDTEMYIGIDIVDGTPYHGGLVGRIVDKMFPITMPYFPPDDPIKVYTEDFLTDPKNGDFDTKCILYAIKPDGERVEINRYFKELPDDWIEISLEEYNERKEMARIREEKK